MAFLEDLIWRMSGGQGPSQLGRNMTPSLMAPLPGAVTNRAAGDPLPSFATATPPMQSNPPGYSSPAAIAATDANRRQFAAPGVGAQISSDWNTIDSLIREREAIENPLAADANRRQFAVPGVGAQINMDENAIAALIAEADAAKNRPMVPSAPAASSTTAPTTMAPAAPGGATMPQMDPRAMIPAAILDALRPRAADPFANVPASQRGYAALGFSPVQAMTGNSRDTARVRGASQFLNDAAGQQARGDANRTALANSVLTNFTAPALQATGQVGAASVTARGQVDSATAARANEIPLANIEAQAKRDVAGTQADAARDTAALEAMAKSFPELAKVIFPNGIGGQAPAAPGAALGNVNGSGLVADGRGGVTVIPPAPVPAQAIGSNMTAPAAPAAAPDAAPVIKTVKGVRYRQVPPGTPGATVANDGNFYVPA